MGETSKVDGDQTTAVGTRRGNKPGVDVSNVHQLIGHEVILNDVDAPAAQETEQDEVEPRASINSVACAIGTFATRRYSVDLRRLHDRRHRLNSCPHVLTNVCGCTSAR